MLAAVHVSWPEFFGLLLMLAVAVGSIVWRVVVWLRERRHQRVVGNVIELRPGYRALASRQGTAEPEERTVKARGQLTGSSASTETDSYLRSADEGPAQTGPAPRNLRGKP